MSTIKKLEDKSEIIFHPNHPNSYAKSIQGYWLNPDDFNVVITKNDCYPHCDGTWRWASYSPDLIGERLITLKNKRWVRTKR